MVAEVQSQDYWFIGLLVLGLFLLYTSFFSEERLMGVIGSSLGIVTWWALGGFWLNLQTDFPGIAWLFYAVGMCCFLVLIYGVWGYLVDRKGILSGPAQ